MRKRAKKCHVAEDDVYSALGGLRKNHPPRMRRATFLSLLSTCASSPHIRHSQRIRDAILSLPFPLNDPPSTLAAATLLYLLTIHHGKDDRLLESPASVKFLIKLLRPLNSTVSEDAAPKFASKLVALQKNDGVLKNTVQILDSSSVAILSTVREVLVDCKELNSGCLNDSLVERPELCPKWLALLIIEKACLPAISIDEISGDVRKTGGNFKEKLREFGGLDAVFEIAMNCQSDMECWMEESSVSTKDLKNDNRLKSLALLLKCLKIMENATFLSKDNQIHLVGLKRKLSPQATPISCVQLVISVIKILSDLCLSQNDSTTSKENRPWDPFSMGSRDSELNLSHKEKMADNEVDFSNSTGLFYGLERATSGKSFNHFRKCQSLTISQSESSQSVLEIPRTSLKCNVSQNTRVSSSTCRSCGGASRGSDGNTKKTQVEDDNRDPFAFDEDDNAPSTWDLLSGKRKKSLSEKYKVTNKKVEDGCQFYKRVCRQKLNNVDASCSSSYSCDEASSSLLPDCLLTAVKVLVNLTNDNPVACQQIAAYGVMETMVLLIAGHFPSFSSSSLSSDQIKENTSKSARYHHQHDRHLTDHEQDFLVAILGLLVNLIEKDGHNRSKLAATRVPLPTSEGLDQDTCSGAIQLLCTIFLASQCGGEEAEEDRYLLLANEAAALQVEKEAEKMIVEAYSALILAFLSTESKCINEAIAANLPYHNLCILVPVLERFVEFHLTLNLISPETHKAVSQVIESCRMHESSAKGEVFAASASFSSVAILTDLL